MQQGLDFGDADFSVAAWVRFDALAGEQVIVSGLMRVRPGMTVQARPEAEAPALAGAGKPEHS